MIDVATRERDRYLARVAARLQGLAPAERDDLLDDLRDHLTEVEAESEGELEAVLGPPERYAAELLASAGLPSEHGADRAGRLRVLWERDRARLERALAHPEVQTSMAGLRQARPAWWALRGWLAVVAVDAVFGSNGSRVAQVLPYLAGSRVVGAMAIVIAICGSVWLGRRTEQGWARRISIVGNAFLVVLLVITAAQLSTAASRLAGGYYYNPEPLEEVLWPEGALRSADGEPITNLYPYGPDGEPLERIRLYDQDGRPVEIVVDQTVDGTPLVTSFELDDRGQPVPHAFPQRQVARHGAEDGGRGEADVPARVPPLTETDRVPGDEDVAEEAEIVPKPDADPTELESGPEDAEADTEGAGSSQDEAPTTDG